MADHLDEKCRRFLLMVRCGKYAAKLNEVGGVTNLESLESYCAGATRRDTSGALQIETGLLESDIGMAAPDAERLVRALQSRVWALAGKGGRSVHPKISVHTTRVGNSVKAAPCTTAAMSTLCRGLRPGSAAWPYLTFPMSALPPPLSAPFPARFRWSAS